MKQLLTLTLVALLGLTAQAQKLTDDKVPATVKAALIKRFPAAKQVAWEKEDARAYEAKFTVGDNKQSANFDEDGKWLSTETNLKKTDIPAAIQSSIAKNFAGFDIADPEKVESPEGVSYKMKLKKEGKKLEVVFLPDGTVKKQKEHKSGDKNKDKAKDKDKDDDND
ncbi:MAG TPA: PepSY-like domain-containing protein [Chryseolinea sp.]